jgi:hypothetical protein
MYCCLCDCTVYSTDDYFQSKISNEIFTDDGWQVMHLRCLGLMKARLDYIEKAFNEMIETVSKINSSADAYNTVI